MLLIINDPPTVLSEAFAGMLRSTVKFADGVNTVVSLLQLTIKPGISARPQRAPAFTRKSLRSIERNKRYSSVLSMYRKFSIVMFLPKPQQPIIICT